MERDAERLYALIWQQFVACQMPPAQFTSTSVIAEAQGYQLRAKGRVVKFDGYLKVLPAVAKRRRRCIARHESRPAALLALSAGQSAFHKTHRPLYRSKPGKRTRKTWHRPPLHLRLDYFHHSRARLCTRTKPPFYANKMGDIVIERLHESFEDLMDYSFTANMEQNLDVVAEGKKIGSRC